METNTAPMEKIHEGSNVRRFREMNGLNQEGLAGKMGDDWTQRKISLLEQKDTIEPEILSEVAKALQVTPEAIQNFTDDAAKSIINTFYDHSVYYNFNAIDKLVEVFEENKKLYERLLASEQARAQLLQDTVDLLKRTSI